MKSRSLARRAERLSFLIFLSTSLSVALTTNSFAINSNSPGGKTNDQASLFIHCPITPASTGGGKSFLLEQNEKSLLVAQSGKSSPLATKANRFLMAGNTNRPSVEANTDEPSVEANTNRLSMEANTNRPSMESNINRPSMEAHTDRFLVAQDTDRFFGRENETNDAMLIAEAVSNGIVLSNPAPAQGEPFKITLTESAANSADSVTFNGETVKLFSDEVDGKPVKTALIAISPLMKPGVYKLVAGDLQATINVQSARFGTQRLTLPKSKDNFNASPGEKETITKAKNIVSDEKRWTGTFEKPVKVGRLSTRFGVKRVVNGKPLKDYFHSGLDFAAPSGTPIYAAAPGRVVVAHTGWKLHGNVVCIDHGRGVVSIGIHMTTVKVKVGDQVEAGQVVGTVGKTGRASGPHLHYGVYVNNVASNPEYWFLNQY
ncbi:MAG: M23 family metallopeptidase [Candidatus Melainabacteria bacterium]|nr:M23 family metallopeptidase [Candidatus Melainabacteria bacterium]